MCRSASASMLRKAPETATTPHQSLPAPCSSLEAKEQKKKPEPEQYQKI